MSLPGKSKIDKICNTEIKEGVANIRSDKHLCKYEKIDYKNNIYKL